MTFDRVLPQPPSQSANGNSGSDSKSESQSPPKKRWNILKAVFGTSRSNDELSSTTSSDESDTAASDAAGEKCADGSLQATNSEPPRPKTPHQPYTFKFSLEWMDRPQWPSKNKRLYTPCLPVASQLHLQLRRSTIKAEDDSTSESSESENETSEKQTRNTDENMNQVVAGMSKLSSSSDLTAAADDKTASSKYAGRALAEWAQIVAECDSFFSRRRDEGVPNDRMVETPTLGVEGFRK